MDSDESSSDEEDAEEDSEVRLLPPAKRVKVCKTDWNKCVVCQVNTKEKLRKSTKPGLTSLISAIKHRKDDIHDRVLSVIDDLESLNVLWHGKCHQSYTSKRNLSYVKSPPEASTSSVDSQEPLMQSRSKVKPMNWLLCIFCQQKTCKRVKKLINVATFDACEAIRSAAEVRNDNEMLLKIRGVDLIAAEAKYHKHCRSQYVSKSNLEFVGFQENEDEDIYGQAFTEMAEEILGDIESGKAFSMKFLLERYQTILANLGCETSGSYKSQRLKRRLQFHFGDKIVFQKQPDPSKSELVYSSSISLQDVINAAAKGTQTSTNLPSVEPLQTSNESTIYHAAQILRSSIKNECQGIPIRPVDLESLSPNKVKTLVPKELYQFLYLIISNPDTVDLSTYECSNIADERHIFSIAQDLIHSTSHGRIKTPKHVGLAMSVRHMTGSKQLITMLNRLGHCCSYDDIEVIDTSLAMEIIAKSETFGVVIPSNITPGVFIQAAADNNDINEETLDGKPTTHATTIVLYQRQQFGPKPKPVIHSDQSIKRRSLCRPATIQALHEFSACGKRPAVKFYTESIKDEWYEYINMVRSNVQGMDMAWLLARMFPTKLFSLELNRIDINQQSLPSWSGFNALISSTIPPLTSVGYCPMINGSPTEFSTIYSLMKNVQHMMEGLGQKHSVVTFDLAIYMKAKEIQWRLPDEFKDTVIRMGGFHVALNFLAVIGKMFKDSGIEDLLIESSIYGSNTATALLNGKSYNRGVRAHKLVMEAFLRLQWQSFGVWLSEQQDNHGVNEDVCLTLINACQNYLGDSDALKETFVSLCEQMPALQDMLSMFLDEAAQQSKLFQFWNTYLCMVLILLRFIRAERDGIWDLHLNAVAEMVPYFYCMDRVNYSRWLPIYIADMKQLPELAPEVHREFVEGNHPVSRSNQSFSQVWTDMALEQSINLDSKTGGGIVGMTQNPAALDRWFITSHERAAITTATKQLCNIEDSDKVGTHKEAAKPRVKRDETDIQKLLNTISSIMSNPFDLCEGSRENPVPLRNIATGVVMPPEIADRLLNAQQIGSEHMHTFIAQRLKTNAVSFWDTLPKLKIKTFATLSKKAQVKSSGEKIITINADRNLFGRLLIAANSRDIDLREVLSYELSTVPYSLAHADGSLRKTTKSTLLGEIEKVCQVEGRLPEVQMTTAFILDGMANIQMLQSARSNSFGELAEKHYSQISAPFHQGSSRVDVVFDRYDLQVSIKDCERAKRGASDALEVKITGPNTPMPKQWLKYISNKVNKSNLTDFLCHMWCEMGKARLHHGQQLVIGGGFADPTKAVLVTAGNIQHISDLQSDHEEADTRMLLHALHASASMERVVVQSPDTDVAVLCIHTFSQMQCGQIWFKTGVKDKIRFIPIHRVVQSLGASMCTALPGFHALTGCDSTSGLSQIGKKKAWKVFVNSKQSQELVGSLGTEIPPSKQTVEGCEKFLCSLYSTSKKAGVVADDVRYWMFCKKNRRMRTCHQRLTA